MWWAFYCSIVLERLRPLQKKIYFNKTSLFENITKIISIFSLENSQLIIYGEF